MAQITKHTAEQGSQEWRELRVGKITSSNAGAALGCHPYKSRDNLLKEMVREARGEFRNLDNIPAVRWGNEHEEQAASEWGFSLGKQVERAYFTTNGDYPDHGSSPDYVVKSDDRALLEIKCPYSLRDNERPEFTSVHQQPHYYAQVQHQLMVTGFAGCWFVQWAPHGVSSEWVEADPEWAASAAPHFAEFMADYEKALNDPDFLKDDERDDEAWEIAAHALIFAQKAYDAAEASLKAAKRDLAELAGEDGDKGCGVYVRVTERRGSINYRKVVEAHFPEADEDDWEEYRGKSSVTTSVGVK